MIWMRSGRKFSTNPMSAMPGRLMSLTVISEREARDSEICSSCRSADWSSYRRAMLSEFTRASVLFEIGGFVRRSGLGRRTVDAPFAPGPVHALVLVAAHAVLEAVGGQFERGQHIGVRLGDDEVLLVRAQRDLGGVDLALRRHDHADLVNALVVALQLLQALLGEYPDLGSQIAVAGGEVDLHSGLPGEAEASGRAVRTGLQA